MSNAETRGPGGREEEETKAERQEPSYARRLLIYGLDYARIFAYNANV